MDLCNYLDVVRVRAKKSDKSSTAPSETKTFSLDPQLTTLQTLRTLLTKAFNVEGDFIISYLVPPRRPDDPRRYLPMLSDWDLYAALFGASSPFLTLKIDVKPLDRMLDDWDIVEPDDAQNKTIVEDDHRSLVASTGDVCSGQTQQSGGLGLGALVKGVARRLGGGASAGSSDASTSTAQPYNKRKNPVNDAEFRTFLDGEGRLVRPAAFRLAVYHGGIEHSLRAVAWRHLLNVYPDNMTGSERITYTSRLCQRYRAFKAIWQTRLKSGYISDEFRLVVNSVRKDVIRTDCSLDFYAPPRPRTASTSSNSHLEDDAENQHVLALFNILTTWALTHPTHSYCQGMSDLASPLLYVLGGDEAETYVCFCALMQRMRHNFAFDGRSMTLKFKHLSEALEQYDPVFFEYLRECHADDLLFCYRWLLLELKREFVFLDALHMLEVSWSSLPPNPPETELSLCDVDITECQDKLPTPVTPGTLNEQSSTVVYKKLRDSLLLLGKSGPVHTDGEAHDEAHRIVPPQHLRCFSTTDADEQLYSTSLPVVTRHQVWCDAEIAAQRRPIATAPNLQTLVAARPRASFIVPRQCCATQLTKGGPHSSSVINHEVAGNLFTLCPSAPDIDETLVCDTEDKTPCECSCSRFDDESRMDRPLRLTSVCCGKVLPPLQPLCDECMAGTERHVEAQTEIQVEEAAGQEGVEGDMKEHDSPIPIACEAESVCGQTGATVSVDETNMESDLRLSEIQDIVANACLSVPESSSRSSGAPTPRSRHTSSECRASNKSRHASAAGTTVGQDSGFVSANGQKQSGAGDGGSKGSNADQKLADIVDFVQLSPTAHLLPPPSVFGDGHPFVIFLCLTLLLMHRDTVIKHGMDYNDMAIHFDKLVRRHNVQKVLRRARQLYSSYLNSNYQDLSPR